MKSERNLLFAPVSSRKRGGKKPLGIYVHIPFCRSKCLYCDFYSLPGGEERMKRYVKALCAHISDMARYAGGYEADTVYFGGGTPSLLPERYLLDILERIAQRFSLAKGAEITLEANPESAQDWRRLRRLRRGGFNRLSLGVQAADDRLLRAVGRVHTWADAERAVEAVRRAGIKNLSADLIYGLPDQDLPGFLSGLEQVAALGPEHLSCYGLKVEEGTPLYGRQGELNLPDDDLQADMYLAAVEYLSAAGYGQYEISNFAREGYASRHNGKYWTLGEYLGFGPGAHSDFGGMRFAYARDLEGYMAGALAGTLERAESERLTERERDTEYIMLSLRTAEGISRQVFEHRYRWRFAPLEAVLRRYEALGCAQPTAEGWRLTPKGFLISNTIITDLWQAHGEEKLRREAAAARGDFRVV